MPVSVECPACESRLQVASKFINTGRISCCPQCSTKLVISAFARSHPANNKPTKRPSPDSNGNATKKLPLSVSCPRCGQAVLFDKRLAGQVVICPNNDCDCEFSMPQVQTSQIRTASTTDSSSHTEQEAEARNLLSHIAALKIMPRLPSWFSNADSINAWVYQCRSPSDLMAPYAPGERERKMLERWYQGGFPGGHFPHGAFEELQRQRIEALSRLFDQGEELESMLKSPSFSDEVFDRCCSIIHFLLKKQSELYDAIKLAVRQMKQHPPAHPPGLQLVFTEDDVRSLPEHLVPEDGSPELIGFYVVRD